MPAAVTRGGYALPVSEHTRASIVIEAEPAAVMAAIADFPNYPSWIPYLRQVEVVSRGPDGFATEVRFMLNAAAVSDDYSLAYEWAEDEVRWHLMRSTVFKTMDGSYRLRAVSGGTEVEYSLSIALGMPLLGVFKRKAEQLVTGTALNALKAYVEA